MNPQNNKDGSGQTETDELLRAELRVYVNRFGWLHGDELDKPVEDLMQVYRRYSHHQTEQVLERLKEQSLPALWVASESKKLVYSEKPSEGVETELIDAELERLKDQPLPTNKDKET